MGEISKFPVYPEAAKRKLRGDDPDPPEIPPRPEPRPEPFPPVIAERRSLRAAVADLCTELRWILTFQLLRAVVFVVPADDDGCDLVKSVLAWSKLCVLRDAPRRKESP